MVPDRRPEHLERRAGPEHELTTGFGVGVGGVPIPAPGVVPGQAPRSPWPRRPSTWTLLYGAAMVAAGMALGIAISFGWVGPAARWAGWFLDFYAGVFALVALSLAVMIGLLATDRTILRPRHRVHAQAVHRAFAFVAVAMLLVHVATKLLRDRVGPLETLVPFAGDHLTTYGAGTAACYLMIIAVGAGIARGRFALTAHPRMWRILHLSAYAAWPLGVAHGLTSGRTPAAWVTAGYLTCLIGVALALAARPFLTRRARREP